MTDAPSKAAVERAKRTVRDWFASTGRTPFRFQTQAWNAYAAGESGLIHATTGAGKTLAAWLGPVIDGLARGELQDPAKAGETETKRRHRSPPLRALWITPLRALAGDTEHSLRVPLEELGLNWSLESRTGDTASKIRSRQSKRLPTALLTTPESLSLALARADCVEQFAHLECVIVDEWHELLGSKRGSQTELCLARLRRWRPFLKTWGLSATLGNIEEAAETLLGADAEIPTILSGGRRKRYAVDSILPRAVERFPWAGHLGLKQLDQVLPIVEDAASSILFTNTRSQTELWYQALLKARPDWAGRIALHHGSLGKESRRWVEAGLKNGELKCVVSTSSLDLGVDFAPVDRVLQVGSPKGVARLLQRAGRSGHAPGQTSRVTCVPTHAFELVEVAAARAAMEAGQIEARTPPKKPLDVLVQHAVTIALGTGFRRDELLEEIRTASSFAAVTDDEWDWCLDFITRGGEALRNYPEYSRVALREGEYRVEDKTVARRHRMSIGTIASDAAVEVRFLKGARLGTVEEAFVSRLKPGDKFLFAGRPLELVKVFELKAWVRKARGVTGAVPRWSGGRMPLSSELAAAVRERLEEARNEEYRGPEMQAVRPILELQQAWSHLPGRDEFLIERTKTRDGHHLFFFPFAGRQVHEGLGALWALRLSRRVSTTFAVAVNDYGVELLSPVPAPLEEALADGLLSPERLREDVAESLNAVEMAKRQFREIARVSGLVFTGYPGAGKSAKQLQASSGLLYDVFQNYDPENLLFRQATEEVLDRQLDAARLEETLNRLGRATVLLNDCRRPTPLAFPLLVDRLRERVSSEKLADRVKRMTLQLETAAD
ncbi:ligase-associated DNA damage response DEXH box helicase [Alienimonas sp. DA493]|uniref:ligase-associated DNA damage response DEXH box helicase n=1 Tax=Alienimonas sp. DA493 TaxID=3373605 RepID=UPI0037543853